MNSSHLQDLGLKKKNCAWYAMHEKDVILSFSEVVQCANLINSIYFNFFKKAFKFSEEFEQMTRFQKNFNLFLLWKC